MSDQFLRDLRKQPNPEFAARLRATLRTVPPSAVARIAPAAGLRKWFAAAASIAVVGFAFTLPPVQAAAEAFLSIFRVRQFTGVEFDIERLRTLETSGLRPEALFGPLELSAGSVQVSYAAAADAGAAAGIRVRVPAWIPAGYSSAGFMASSEMEASMRLNTAGLQTVIDTLGLGDVELPEGLDGEVVTVHVPSIVTQTFVNGDRNVHVIQAASPEVALPAGVDFSKLAYAALRVLGMPRDEAYRMSVTIDWRSTLIVPVPRQAVAYRPINVAGNEGLLIEGLAHDEDHPGGVLMWSSGDQTFAVTGALSGEELLEIAQTLQ